MSGPTQAFVLSEKKRQLLAKLLKEDGVKAPSSPQGIQPRKGAGPYPLSFAQQRLWFLDQLVPGNPFYNVDIVIPIFTALNVEVLKKALEEIVSRHENLRTTFASIDGAPAQVVSPSISLPFVEYDLSQLPTSERGPEASRIATDEARAPFDLGCGPLIRTTLLRLSETEYVLLVTMHHIISDGWSMGIFYREMTALYAAFIAGNPSPLPDLPVQYADFAVWQRDWLQGDVLHSQLGYWKHQLHDLPLLQLPTD